MRPVENDPQVPLYTHQNNLFDSSQINEACSFDFSENQKENYDKEGFILHSSVAKVIGNLIGRAFYDDDVHLEHNIMRSGNATNDEHENENENENEVDFTRERKSPWSLTPEQLRNLVVSNIFEEIDESTSFELSRYPIYGSAIAFDPGVWDVVEGLEEGVPYPAVSDACIANSQSCSKGTENATDFKLKELQTTKGGKSIYCPYAFRGNPEEPAYDRCSSREIEFCPKMDLSRAYDYTDTSLEQTEWYTAPRCLYLRDGIRTGYWTSPYFDEGAGSINMVTYSQPIISRGGKFLGIVTIDIEVDALCFGDQCKTPVDYNYLTSIRPVGVAFFAVSATLSLICALWTYRHRKNRVVKASQPFFLILICIGCFIMASSIIPLSIDDSIAGVRGCSIACMSFPWLLSLGFTITFSALFSKVWRLNRVYRSASRFRKVTVKEEDVLLPFFVLFLCNCAILIAWTVVDSYEWFRTEPDEFHQSWGYCGSNGDKWIVFLSLILSINFSALVLANYQAFKARHIATEFNESSYIMMTMICLLQSLMIGVPLMVIVHNNAVVYYFIRSILIFSVTVAIQLLMFVPKALTLRQREKAQADGRRISNITSTHRCSRVIGAADRFSVGVAEGAV